MRAVLIDHCEFLDNEQINQKEILHHLSNVIRLKISEKILLMNGNGSKREYVVESIAKKEISLRAINSKITLDREVCFDLLLAKPKKEAFDLSIKMASQIGVSNILVWKSEYSQKFPINESRVDKIIRSACEQSNNLFIPKIVEIETQQVSFSEYEQVFFLNSQKENPKTFKAANNFLLVIGPEGGFSPNEMELFEKLPNSQSIFLPTPILRTETAVSFGLGYVISKT